MLWNHPNMMLWTSSHPPDQHGLDLMDLLFWWQNNGQTWFGQDQYVVWFIWTRVKTVSRMGLSFESKTIFSCLDFDSDTTIFWSQSSISRLIGSLLTTLSYPSQDSEKNSFRFLCLLRYTEINKTFNYGCCCLL